MMSDELQSGQRVRHRVRGWTGKVVRVDHDEAQVIAPNTTYSVQWDDGSLPEALLYPNELVVIEGYKIDERVAIALDALDDDQREVLHSVLRDREHFLSRAADPRNVRRISKSQPIYALKVPSEMTIIYKRTGDEIEVLDLMGETTLERYGAKQKATRPESPGRSSRPKGSI